MVAAWGHIESLHTPHGTDTAPTAGPAAPWKPLLWLPSQWGLRFGLVNVCWGWRGYRGRCKALRRKAKKTRDGGVEGGGGGVCVWRETVKDNGLCRDKGGGEHCPRSSLGRFCVSRCVQPRSVRKRRVNSLSPEEDKRERGGGGALIDYVVEIRRRCTVGKPLGLGWGGGGGATFAWLHLCATAVVEVGVILSSPLLCCTP